jgi:hypothetical protein
MTPSAVLGVLLKACIGRRVINGPLQIIQYTEVRNFSMRLHSPQVKKSWHCRAVYSLAAMAARHDR